MTAFQGLGLRVALGGIDAIAVSNMSGGWRATFNLASAGAASLTFRYNLTQTPNYESNEPARCACASIRPRWAPAATPTSPASRGNGEGGSNVTTGWQQVTLALGTLAAGSHELVIGGFNNQKTAANESTTVLIDDVLLTAARRQLHPREQQRQFCTPPGQELRHRDRHRQLRRLPHRQLLRHLQLPPDLRRRRHPQRLRHPPAAATATPPPGPPRSSTPPARSPPPTARSRSPAPPASTTSAPSTPGAATSPPSATSAPAATRAAGGPPGPPCDRCN